MAFVRGADTVLLGDATALTGQLNNLTFVKNTPTADVTVFGSDDRAYIAGPGDGSVSVNGLFERATSDAYLEGTIGSVDGELITGGVGGFTIGNRAVLARVRAGSYNVAASVQDAVRVSGSVDVDAGVRGGVALHDLTEESGSGNFASVDGSASSAFGAVAHLHVTAFTGTDAEIKVQHSANDSTWADLITFTTVSGVTQERATVAGTVNRYLRAAVTGGTFSAVTFVVAAARNRH